MHYNIGDGTLLSFGIGICNIIHCRMGQAYNESYVEVGKSKSVNFCNKLFTAWDFNITDPDTAKLRRAQIKTDFEASCTQLNHVPALLSCCMQKIKY